MACPATPAPVTEEEQSGSLLGVVSGYSGGAGTVRVFASGSGTTQPLATGTIEANGTFSVLLPNGTAMAPYVNAVTCASIGSGTAPEDGCVIEGTGKIAGVEVAVYNSATPPVLLGYLQLKTPPPLPAVSRTVVHYFADAPLKIQAKKTSGSPVTTVDNYIQSFRKGWNLGLITVSSIGSGFNYDHIITGTYPREVRWALVASPTAVSAPHVEKFKK